MQLELGANDSKARQGSQCSGTGITERFYITLA